MFRSNWDLRHTEKGQKENLHIKSITMKNPVTVWSEITQYNDKKAISIANLFETTWLSR